MGNPRGILYLLLISLLLTRNAEGTLFMERYDWLPSESAHKQYPMTLIKGDLILKDGSNLYVPARSVIRNGWGEIGSTHIVGKKMKSLPVRLTMTWFSFAEDKFYTGDFLLPYDKILGLFRNGTTSPSSGEKVTFDRIIVGIGPEGTVSVWLDAYGEVIEVATYKGKEATVDWKLVVDNDEVTRREYVDSVLKDSLSDDQYHKLKKNGVPTDISSYFNRRYRWSLSVVGGNQQEILVKCLNGEAEFFGFSQRQNGRTHRALPKGANIRWADNAGKRNVAKITFDEAEIAAAFRTLSKGNIDHPMQLQLQVGVLPGVVEASVKDSNFIIRLKKMVYKDWRLLEKKPRAPN